MSLTGRDLHVLLDSYLHASHVGLCDICNWVCFNCRAGKNRVYILKFLQWNYKLNYKNKNNGKPRSKAKSLPNHHLPYNHWGFHSHDLVYILALLKDPKLSRWNKANLSIAGLSPAHTSDKILISSYQSATPANFHRANNAIELIAKIWNWGPHPKWIRLLGFSN